MYRMKKNLLLLSLLALALTACREDDPEPRITALQITAPDTTLYRGDSLRLRLTPTPPDADIRGAVWTSGDSLVAVVTPDGLVRCVGPGRTAITARLEGTSLSATYDLTVAARATQSIAFSEPTLSLLIGEEQPTALVFTPANADDRRVVYTSSDTAVATVSSQGVITARGRGKAIVRARTVGGGQTAECLVSVQHFTERISVWLSGTWIYESDNLVSACARMTLRNDSNRDLFVERFIVESDGREIHREEIGRTLSSGSKLACDVTFKNAHDPQFKYQFTVGSEQYEAHYRPHMIGAKTLPADGPRTLPIVVSRRR